MKGNLHKMTKKVLQSLSHYKFRQRLTYKSNIYGTTFNSVREDYTSKTCGKCGNIDNKLGSKKIYDCRKCGVKMDRDVNASRNILLKNYICQKY